MERKKLSAAASCRLVAPTAAAAEERRRGGIWKELQEAPSQQLRNLGGWNGNAEVEKKCSLTPT
jgi:hypothetical protein